MRDPAPERLRVVESLAGVPAAQWNALSGGDPFVSHELLGALIESGCASGASGWLPQFILLERGGALAGAMPIFLKSHSWGEYVFDWAWAQAYQRHGLRYYTKLVVAVPFTPVSGSRLLSIDAAVRARLREAIVDLGRDAGASSAHILFAAPSDLIEAGGGG